MIELLKSASSPTLSLQQCRDALSEYNQTETLAGGVILLSHGHLNPAHDISQTDKGPVGSYLHGLMHRLEPDLPNACYWFGRVGSHEICTAIAAQFSEQEIAATADIPHALADQVVNPTAITEALMSNPSTAVSNAAEYCLAGELRGYLQYTFQRSL